MTRDEKIAWLKRYAEAEREIDRLFEQVRRWNSRAEKMTVSFNQVPGGGYEGSPQEKALDAIAELQGKIMKQMERQEAIKAEVEGAIDGLAEQPHRDVLRYRYLQSYSMERIAVILSYSYRQVLRHHVNGVSALSVGEP